VQRLHPSQGGAPVRGNDVLIGSQVSMQQQHDRDFCSLQTPACLVEREKVKQACIQPLPHLEKPVTCAVNASCHIISARV
jgi:hypothetical protein